MTEPKLLTEADVKRLHGKSYSEWPEVLAELRERGLIAPEPDSIDRLREALEDIHGIYLDREKMERVFKRAGLDQAQRAWTREMVRRCLAKAFRESAAEDMDRHDFSDDGEEGGCTRNAIRLSACLHAALTGEQA